MRLSLARSSALILTVIMAGGLVVAGATPALAARALPDVEGPDIPTVEPADAVVTAFENERWSYSADDRTRAVKVPVAPGGGAWDRIVVEYSSTPEGDPWDRLFYVRIADAEVIRGTTPRTEFTVERDITQYAALLPQGEKVLVTAGLSSWVGALKSTVKIRFYDGEVGPRAALDTVVPALNGTLFGHESSAERQVLFPDAAPTSATVEIFLTGHAQRGEFWYQYGGPPDFHVYVDGTEVATVTAMPYVYALIGLTGGESSGGIHKYTWWTAHQAADKAGVHGGVGEIAPYRAVLDLDAAALAKLRGARTVKIVEEGRYQLNGDTPVWPFGVSFLLDGVTDNCMTVANPDQTDSDTDGVGDACDGPALRDAAGIQDGGPIAEGDTVVSTYPGVVSCDGADPAQFTYNDRNDSNTPASAIECSGSDITVRFPDGTLSPGFDGTLAYVESSSTAARILVGGAEAADHDSEAVTVGYIDRPVIVWASATADPEAADQVSVFYQESVDCLFASTEQFVYRTADGETAAEWIECDGSSSVVQVYFPDGTIDSLGADPVLSYGASPDGAAGVTGADGAGAVVPDEQRVAVAVP